MAEEDWYGPFPRLARYASAIIAALAGVSNVIAGAMGYDLGRRSWIVGETPPTRWMGGTLWDQVMFGVLLLALAAIAYYVARKPANADQNRPKGSS